MKLKETGNTVIDDAQNDLLRSEMENLKVIGAYETKSIHSATAGNSTNHWAVL